MRGQKTTTRVNSITVLTKKLWCIYCCHLSKIGCKRLSDTRANAKKFRSSLYEKRETHTHMMNELPVIAINYHVWERLSIQHGKSSDFIAYRVFNKHLSFLTAFKFQICSDMISMILLLQSGRCGFVFS